MTNTVATPVTSSMRTDTPAITIDTMSKNIFFAPFLVLDHNLQKSVLDKFAENIVLFDETNESRSAPSPTLLQYGDCPVSVSLKAPEISRPLTL